MLPPGLATLALVLFCLDDAHAMAAGWVAARNASVACALGLLGLLATSAGGSSAGGRGRCWRRWPSPLGLAASEMAVGMLMYLFAWELVQQRRGWWQALAPAAALLLAYVVVYRLTDSGARASGGYLDPAGDPAGFLSALPGGCCCSSAAWWARRRSTS